MSLPASIAYVSLPTRSRTAVARSGRAALQWTMPPWARQRCRRRTSGTSWTRCARSCGERSCRARTRSWPRTAIPDDLRSAAAEMGLFGYAIPQEWGGLGLDLTQDVELALEFGYTTLALPLDVRHQQRHRRAGAGRLRDRRAEDAVAAADRLGRGGGVVRAHRAGSRIEPGGAAHPRPPRRRRLGHRRARSGSSPTPPSPDLFVVFARTSRAGGPATRGSRCSSSPRTHRASRRAEGREDGPGGRLDRRCHPSTTCTCPRTRWSATRCPATGRR